MTKATFRSDMGVELVDFAGSGQRIADAARVSTGTSGEKVTQGFIDFLMKNRHGSPFEHAWFTWRIECPIFVAREFQRHRIASYNEESGRYKKLEPVFYAPHDSRPLTQVGKPGEYEFVHGDDADLDHCLVENEFCLVAETAYETYEHLLDEGIAREVARMVLPLNTFTSFYVSMNARALMNFLSLRTKEVDSVFPSYPQYEIEEVARGMEAYFISLLPLVSESFDANGRVAP